MTPVRIVSVGWAGTPVLNRRELFFRLPRLLRKHAAKRAGPETDA
jgi:hypothetical protein